MFVDAVFIGDKGEIEVKLTEEITEKLNTELRKSPTYFVRILALRGVIEFALRLKLDQKEKEKDEKYRLARKSLDEYGFNPIDEITVEQLNQIIDQINN